MKVFITGGTGYVGRATIRALTRQGHEVLALARGEEAARTASGLGATPVAGDLTDLGTLRETAGRADGVIHQGQSHTEDAAEIDRAAAGALQDGTGDRPYVHTGGVWVYGDTDGVADENSPLNPPPIVAWRPENEKRVLSRAATGGHPVVVMPGVVYGHSGGLPQTFFVEPALASGAVPCIGDGSNHWALVHVEDIADLYVLALNAPAGGVYAGVCPQSPALADITQALSQAAGRPGRIKHLSLDEAREQMGPIAEAFALDQRISGLHARRELGWEPVCRDVLTELAEG